MIAYESRLLSGSSPQNRVFRQSFHPYSKRLGATSAAAQRAVFTPRTSTSLTASTSSSASELGFGFSAGGLLFPYYIGVAMCLRDEFGLLTDATPVAGSSAGSLIAVTAKSGISEEDLLEATLALAQDCRSNGTRFRLKSVLEYTLEKVLPEDIHIRCSGTAHIAVTQVWPQVSAKVISHFISRKEVIDTLLVSCHIPWYFDGSLATSYGSGFAFDGGIPNLMPLPPNCALPVRVTCFPSSNMKMYGGIGISPDTYEEWPYSMSQMLSWALEPAPEEMLMFLVEKGKKDTRSWATAYGYSPLEREIVLSSVNASSFSAYKS